MANQIKYKVGFDVDNKSLKSLQNELIQLQKMTSKDFMKINPGTSLSQAEKELQQIKKTARQVDEALDKAFSPRLNSLNLGEFKKQLNGLNINKIYNDFSKMGATGQAAFRNLSGQMMTVNTRIRESHSLLDKMATTLSNTLKWNVASSAINGMSRSIDQAWGYVKSLDGSLNDIRIVTGKSSDEMARFAVQANNAAKQLGKTTTDYTKASLIYAQQGLSDEEIEARARITLKAANVTGQSTDAVSEELTAVWNGYKVTAEEAEVYVDRLAAIAAHTASNLEELSTGMSKVASAAAAMGVGEEQLAAQLSTIISVTRQAPESVGTALRTVYARISDIKAGIDEDGVTLGNYSGKMQALGFSVLDATGNLRDMGEVMEEIGNHWQDLTREQQVNLAQTMAGQRQYSNLIALFDNFSEYNRALGIAQNAAGTLQEQQDTYMESTAAHLNQLKASVEDVYDSFMNRDSLDSVNDLIDALSDGATAIARFIDSLGGGMNILSSLGSLGVTVFSKQIAGSIQTTINNLSRGREQAQAFQIAINNSRELQEKGYGNNYTKNLIANESQILNMGQNLPIQKFEELQQGFNEITTLANQVEILDEKEKKLLATYDALKPAIQQIIGEYNNSIEATLQDQGAIQDLTNKLTNLRDAYAPVIKQQQKLNQALQQLNTPGKGDKDQIAANNKQIKEGLTSYIKQIKTVPKGMNQSIYDTLSQEQQNIIQQAESFLPTVFTKIDSKSITEENLQKQSKDLESFFAQIREIIIKGRANVIEGLDGVENDVLDKTRQAKENAQQRKGAAEQRQQGKINDAQTYQKIKNWTELAGGIAQVGSSIQQIQNIGRIFHDEDLSAGQKLLQITTNLAMSLPLLINGLGKVGTFLNLLTVTTGTNIAANTAESISLKHLGISFEEAAIKVRLFNTTLAMNPILLAIAGVAAAVAAIAMIAKGIEAANQKIIDTNKDVIESENKKQEQLEKNKQVASSVEQLNTKYQEGSISRAQLKESIQDLIDKYELEGASIHILTTNYDNLTEAIRQFRLQQAKQALESAKREKRSAEKVIQTQGKKYKQGQSFQVDLGAGGIADHSALSQTLLQAGATKDALSYKFKVDYDPKSIAQLYNVFQQLASDMETTMDPEQLLNYPAYEQITDFLSEWKDAVEDFNNALNDVNENQSFINFADQNLQNISNFQEYLQKRNELIQILNQDKRIDGDTAELTDNYLKENYGDLFYQFDEGISKIEEYKEKFGEIPSQINTLIKSLTEEQLEKFFELDPENIKSWEQLLYILQHIDELSKKDAIQVGDIQARQKANLDNFSKYDAVSEKVSQGKEIKEADFQELTPQLQKFFDYAGEGMYKLGADAKGFYDAVDSLKLQGFQDTLAAINNELQSNNKIQQGLDENKFTWDEVSQNSVEEFQAGGTQYRINQDLVDKQLAYLQAATQTGSEEAKIVEYLRQQYDSKQLTLDQARQINELIDQTKDKTQGLQEKNQELKKLAQETYQQIHDAMFPLDEDVDEKKLQKLTKDIQDIADQYDNLADSLKTDGRTAEDVAESLLRFSDATKDVADNYDDWMKALSSGSLGDQMEAIEGLRDAYADLLDFPEDAFSDQFLTSADNLNLLKEAANGSTEAYDQLMQAAQQDIATQVGLDTTAFDNAFDALMDQYYQGQNLEDMQIGASLNNEGFLQGLTDMVNAAGMTAQQATAYLASMGVDAQVIEQDTEAEETSEAMEYNTDVTPTTHHAEDRVLTQSGSGLLPVDVSQDITSWDQKVQAIPKKGKTKKQNKSFALKVTSAHKSSGGGFKYSNAPGKKSSGGKGSGGGGGGGGGGGSKPDTSKKDKKKPLKTQKDPYHDINIQLQKINRQLERVQDKQERLYGKQLIDNLNKQNQLLEQQKNKLKQKSKIQQEDLENQRKALKQMGATFDKQGNLTNYSDLISQRQAEIQAMYDQYNKGIQDYNNSTNADYKKALSQSLSQYDKQIKEKEDSLKELTSAISKYDKTREQLQDSLDEIDEATQKQIEINIKKFNMQLEIRLDMGKAERDWNKFKRNVLEKTDVLKDSNFDKIFKDAKKDFEDLFSYFEVHGSVGSIQTLTAQLNATREQIEQIDKTGTSAIYGDNKAQAMEDLQNNLKELMDQLQSVEEYIDAIDQKYLDTIDDIQEGFEKQIENYEYVQQLLQNDIDLITLLYGDKNYNAMQKYYNQLYQNDLKQLDSLRKQADFWKQEWAAAVEEGDTNAAEKFEENWKTTISNINSLLQDSIKRVQDSYEKASEKIYQALENKLTNGKGFDYLEEEWDLINKNADEYLDNINAAFEVQQTQRKYQNALNDVKSIKNQQALKKLMDQQLDILKNKDKLTQYDIDRAQKLLEIEQARIALEDARSAKTSMRLKRDSQGNYSYEYYADQQGIGEAEENYAIAQQDLVNLDKDHQSQIFNKGLAAVREYAEKVKQIQDDLNLSEQKQMEKIALLNTQYSEYLASLAEQLADTQVNLKQSIFNAFAYLYNTDVQNYKQMAQDQQDILIGEIVPGFNGGIADMIKTIAGEGGLSNVTEEYFTGMQELINQNKNKFQELADAAGINLEDIGNGIDDNATELSNLIQTNDELIQKMNTQLSSINALREAAKNLEDQYKDVTDAAKDMVSQIHDYIQAQQAQAADYVANQEAMADAYADAQYKMADAFCGALARMVAAINAANSGSGSGSSRSGSGNGSGSDGSGYNNDNDYSVVNDPYGASNTYGVQDGSGNYVEISGDLDYLKKKYGFATGGYTGNWNSSEGRLALLHEKELVLNQEDTANILDAVQIIRALNDSVLGKAYNINSGLSLNSNSQNNQQTLEQNVHITASFPNVDNKKQIKEAFNELTNLAAQRTMRR